MHSMCHNIGFLTLGRTPIKIILLRQWRRYKLISSKHCTLSQYDVIVIVIVIIIIIISISNNYNNNNYNTAVASLY